MWLVNTYLKFLVTNGLHKQDKIVYNFFDFQLLLAVLIPQYMVKWTGCFLTVVTGSCSRRPWFNNQVMI